MLLSSVCIEISSRYLTVGKSQLYCIIARDVCYTVCDTVKPLTLAVLNF